MESTVYATKGKERETLKGIYTRFQWIPNWLGNDNEGLETEYTQYIMYFSQYIM